MSRTDTIDRSLRSTFRDRLEEIGVESTVVDRASLAEALESRLEPPTIASLMNEPYGDALPAGVTVHPTEEELRSAKTGVTPGRLAVAEHGSVVVSSNPEMDGPVSLYPPKHVAIVDASDIVPDIGAALERLSEAFSGELNDAVFVTGPSSTGDMGELVVGVHGPAEMEVVIVE